MILQKRKMRGRVMARGPKREKLPQNIRVGKVLEQNRNRLGLTLGDVVEMGGRAGIDFCQSTLSRIENGETRLNRAIGDFLVGLYGISYATIKEAERLGATSQPQRPDGTFDELFLACDQLNAAGEIIRSLEAAESAEEKASALDGTAATPEEKARLQIRKAMNHLALRNYSNAKDCASAARMIPGAPDETKLEATIVDFWIAFRVGDLYLADWHAPMIAERSLAVSERVHAFGLAAVGHYLFERGRFEESRSALVEAANLQDAAGKKTEAIRQMIGASAALIRLGDAPLGFRELSRWIQEAAKVKASAIQSTGETRAAIEYFRIGEFEEALRSARSALKTIKPKRLPTLEFSPHFWIWKAARELGLRVEEAAARRAMLKLWPLIDTSHPEAQEFISQAGPKARKAS